MTIKRNLITAMLVAAAGSAAAHEPGTPTAVPSGSTIGVPTGANPPPGFYFTSRSDFFFGHVYDGDTKTSTKLNVQSSAQQIHWVAETPVLGASYRAMLSIPVVFGQQDAFGNETDESGMGDITISPLNLTWMVSPGLFFHVGTGLSMPAGKYSTAPGAINLGMNAYVGSFDAAVSYVQDGWNLTAHANYFLHAKNRDTDYRSGDEFLLNWTAMKDVGGFSIGPVGYFRHQLTDDKNSGNFYGGTIAGKARQYGVGFGITKNFGKVEVNVNYVHDFKVENTAGGNKVLFNLTVPLSF